MVPQTGNSNPKKSIPILFVAGGTFVILFQILQTKFSFKSFVVEHLCNNGKPESNLVLVKFLTNKQQFPFAMLERYTIPLPGLSKPAQSRQVFKPEAYLANSKNLAKKHFTRIAHPKFNLIIPNGNPENFLLLENSKFTPEKLGEEINQYMKDLAPGSEPIYTLVDLQNRYGAARGLLLYNQSLIPEMYNLAKNAMDKISTLTSLDFEVRDAIEQGRSFIDWNSDLERGHTDPFEANEMYGFSNGVRDTDSNVAFFAGKELNTLTDKAVTGLQILESHQNIFEVLDHRRNSVLATVASCKPTALGLHEKSSLALIISEKTILTKSLMIQYENKKTSIEYDLAHTFKGLEKTQIDEISIPYYLIRKNLNRLSNNQEKFKNGIAIINQTLKDERNADPNNTEQIEYIKERFKEAYTLIEKSNMELNKNVDINEALISFIDQKTGFRKPQPGLEISENWKKSIHDLIDRHTLGVSHFLMEGRSLQPLCFTVSDVDKVVFQNGDLDLKAWFEKYKNVSIQEYVNPSRFSPGGSKLTPKDLKSSIQLASQYGCTKLKGNAGNMSEKVRKELKTKIALVEENKEINLPSHPLPSGKPRSRTNQGTKSLTYPEYSHNERSRSAMEEASTSSTPPKR